MAKAFGFSTITSASPMDTYGHVWTITRSIQCPYVSMNTQLTNATGRSRSLPHGSAAFDRRSSTRTRVPYRTQRRTRRAECEQGGNEGGTAFSSCDFRSAFRRAEAVDRKEPCQKTHHRRLADRNRAGGAEPGREPRIGAEEIHGSFGKSIAKTEEAQEDKTQHRGEEEAFGRE